MKPNNDLALISSWVWSTPQRCLHTSKKKTKVRLTCQTQKYVTKKILTRVKVLVKK